MNELNFFMLYPNARITYYGNPEHPYTCNNFSDFHMRFTLQSNYTPLDYKIHLRKPDSLTEEEKKKIITIILKHSIFNNVTRIEFSRYEMAIWTEEEELESDIWYLADIPFLIADYLRSINIFIDYHLGEEFIENNIEWEQ